MIAGSSNTNQGDLRKSVRLNFKVKKGDPFTYSLDIYEVDANGNEVAVDLTGYIVQGSVKKNKTDKNVLFWLVTSVSGSTLTLTRSDLKNYEAGKYVYDVEVKDTNGVSLTHLEGTFIIEQDVTEFVTEIYKYITHTFKSLVSFVNPVAVYLRHITIFGSFIEIVLGLHYRFATTFKSLVTIVTTPFYSFGFINVFRSNLRIISAIDFRQSTIVFFQGIISIMKNPIFAFQQNFFSQVTIEIIIPA